MNFWQKYEKKYYVEKEDIEAISNSDLVEEYFKGNKLKLGSSGRSVWFDGDDLYSYRTKIAEKQGKKIFLNDTDYSQTTRQFQNQIQYSAPKHGYEVIVLSDDYGFGESGSFSLEHGPEA